MKKLFTKISDFIKEKMLKEYFLFMADEPLKGLGIIGIPSFIAALVYALIIFPANTNFATSLVHASVLAITVVFVIWLINAIVIWIKITAFRRDKNRIVLIKDGGKFIKYSTPLWGKHEYCTIKLPEDWDLPLNGKQFYNLDIITKLRIHKQTATIYYQFNFLFKGELNDSELNTIVKCFNRQGHHRRISFAEGIQCLFEAYNQEVQNNEVLEIIIPDWLESNEERNVLHEKIKQNTGFPVKLFDNMQIHHTVKKVEISLACILG